LLYFVFAKSHVVAFVKYFVSAYFNYVYQIIILVITDSIKYSTTGFEPIRFTWGFFYNLLFL